jgi:hypothetical protein
MALFTVGPWAIFLIYDVVLYFWRAVAYEVPVVGGRARGRQRPRAPTLTERPDGETRTLGLIKITPLDGDEPPPLLEDECVDSVTRRKAAKIDDDTQG